MSKSTKEVMMIYCSEYAFSMLAFRNSIGETQPAYSFDRNPNAEKCCFYQARFCDVHSVTLDTVLRFAEYKNASINKFDKLIYCRI